MERPLAAPLFSLIIGLSCAGLYPCFLPRNILPSLLAVTLLTVFLKHRYPFLVSLTLLMFAAGNLLLEPYVQPRLTPDHIARFQSDEPVIVEGVIDSRPEATERGMKLYVRTEEVYREKRRTLVSGRLLLSVGEGRGGWMTGDRVRFASRIRMPRNYGLPGEFDFERYLAYKGIFATSFVKTPGEIILIREGVDYRLQRAVDVIADRIGTFIDRNVPGGEGAILRALIIGDMGYIARATRDAYSRTGVNHILSISGFHVGVISLFIFQILMGVAKRSEFLLLHFNLRRFILLLTLPLVIFYLFLSGAAPATTRSVIMIAVCILALLIERETDPVNSLLLAAAVILALTPPALFDISFQLSFLALWGIIVLTPLFMAPFTLREKSFTGKMLLFLMASAAATIATLLTVAYYFHRASATGLISNFFIVPLMGYGAVVLGFSALPFIVIAPPIAKLLLLAAAFLVKLSNMIIALLDTLPTLPVINPTRLDLLLFYLFLCSLTFIRNRRGRLACCCSLVVVLAGSAAIPADRDAGRLAIIFFSIGQGDSILVNFPDGKKMLVDGGGKPGDTGWDTGERLLAPALWKMGITRIDYMVLTHPDTDHLQGLKYVAANFKVGEFWTGRNFPESPEFLKLLTILRGRGVPVRFVNAAAGPISIGETRVEPLSPPDGTVPPPSGNHQELNDDSLVFRLVAGRSAVLFTGDIGSETEERLVLHPERLRCTILKIPHHGSRYSSSPEFLRAAAPEIAVVSAGYKNSYHLPTQETLGRLQALGIQLFRTDLDGTIRVICGGSGENVSVEKWGGHFH